MLASGTGPTKSGNSGAFSATGSPYKLKFRHPRPPIVGLVGSRHSQAVPQVGESLGQALHGVILAQVADGAFGNHLLGR